MTMIIKNRVQPFNPEEKDKNEDIFGTRILKGIQRFGG